MSGVMEDGLWMVALKINYEVQSDHIELFSTQRIEFGEMHACFSKLDLSSIGRQSTSPYDLNKITTFTFNV